MVRAMRVSLFIPCLVDQFYPQVGENVVHVLKKLGLRVDYTDEQICCGQPFFKSGQWERARPLAKRMLRAFGDAQKVVAPSGSCVGMIRNHYAELFPDEPGWLQSSHELSAKVYELSEFLVHVAQVDDLGAIFRSRVTFHDSCQVLRGLGVASEPRQLLRRVKGLELVEMRESDVCCGFGGQFSLKFPHIAEAMVREKVNHITATGAQVVVGCEMSCLMHIGGYMAYKGIPVRTMHLADVLAQV